MLSVPTLIVSRADHGSSRLTDDSPMSRVRAAQRNLRRCFWPDQEAWTPPSLSLLCIPYGYLPVTLLHSPSLRLESVPLLSSVSKRLSQRGRRCGISPVGRGDDSLTCLLLSFSPSLRSRLLLERDDLVSGELSTQGTKAEDAPATLKGGGKGKRPKCGPPIPPIMAFLRVEARIYRA